MWRTVPDISVVQKYNFCYWFQSGKKSEVAGWAVTSHVLNQGQRCGALGFPNILPQPLSVYKTSLRSQGSRDLLFGVKKPGAISGDVLSPGCCGSMVGWVMTRQSVCVTALGLLQTSLPAPVSPNTLCLPHTEECLSKPVPWKTELEGFSGPLPLIAQLCFSFCWFLSLCFRLSSSHQGHCQRSCVIPVGKLPKFLQALGSCYYGSKSKLCLG